MCFGGRGVVIVCAPFDYDGAATSISPLYLSVLVVGADQARLEM